MAAGARQNILQSAKTSAWPNNGETASRRAGWLPSGRWLPSCRECFADLLGRGGAHAKELHRHWVRSTWIARLRGMRDGKWFFRPASGEPCPKADWVQILTLRQPSPMISANSDVFPDAFTDRSNGSLLHAPTAVQVRRNSRTGGNDQQVVLRVKIHVIAISAPCTIGGPSATGGGTRAIPHPRPSHSFLNIAIFAFRCLASTASITSP